MLDRTIILVFHTTMVPVLKLLLPKLNNTEFHLLQFQMNSLPSEFSMISNNNLLNLWALKMPSVVPWDLEQIQ